MGGRFRSHRRHDERRNFLPQLLLAFDLRGRLQRQQKKREKEREREKKTSFLLYHFTVKGEREIHSSK